MAAGSVNDVIRQNMASTRAWYEAAEWINFGHTPTRIDGDTFSVSSDQTATYHVGRRLKVAGSATGYCTISAVTYNAPNTIVDVTMDSGSLPATLSTVYVSISSATNTSVPQNNNPAWTGTAAGANLTLSGTLTLTNVPLAIASGGMGANSVAGARSNLGVSATGSDTTYAFRSNNLSDLTNAATARNNLGVPGLTGSGASGTWSINISGNAATASSASSASSASQVANALTFNSGGSGDASGNTFNGSAARTISYNSIGAPKTDGTGASGTWGINISGNAATATNATTAGTITSQAASATTDTTNASNISSGTLAAARIPKCLALTGVTISTSDPSGTPADGDLWIKRAS
jgi:hypothetical protein